jgi:heptaprenyl diphosphate synthase
MSNWGKQEQQSGGVPMPGEDNLYCEPVRLSLHSLEGGLHRIMQTGEGCIRSVSEQLLSMQGKRVRPALFFLSANLWREELEPFVPVALALELVHTATLIHDDIIDRSPLRRGQPTINASFGDQVSVLTGDYLFARAFSLLAGYGNIEVIHKMADLVAEMSEAEIEQQMERFALDTDQETYFKRIGKKTARFFAVCTGSGGIVAGAGKTETQTLERIGFLIGLAYQIIDDILDFTGADLMGKPVAVDLRQGIITLPLIHLLQTSPKRETLRAIISSRQIDEELLGQLSDALRACRSLDYARDMAGKLIDEALKTLELLPEHPEREKLAKAARSILERGY